ncbi:MAG TPA: DeoR/GlpR family DNA-binding transcription regulator [Polaromonas sp.]|uniref:DeoR/GlpR family DNA-binding transcription regulator n=1 Tax=Polaromonas sp. TaxID=1869339 RepID=UPI002D347559|nr:DeoR/GlpR family DNA-binding transcription regulator [Polaromonas sp.]HYW57511.1 DeoR/GlpR family DNA-binding transcription regulator [Polaromonas sp.]
MLPSQRRNLLLTRLAQDGQLIATDLSEELGTSEDTIRRDLRELAQAGKLTRVHGGALPASPADGDVGTREQIAPRDKQGIGRAAAAMVRPGQVVIIDGGTTALEMVRHLPEDLHATVFTHSPAVAIALARCPHIVIQLIGGRLFRHSMVTMGAGLMEQLSGLRVDVFFMGATGLHAGAGVTTGDAEEAAVKRALHRCAAETVLLASGEKLGAASACRIMALADVSAVVVRKGASTAWIRSAKRAGVRVVLAG